MKRKLYIILLLVPLVMLLTFFLLGAHSGRQVNGVNVNSALQFSEQGRNDQTSIVPGIVMVKIKSHEVAQSLAKASTLTGLPTLDATLSKLGVTSVKKAFRHKPIPLNSNIPDISRILKIEIPMQFNPLLVARELAADPNVEYAEPVYERQIDVVPNDPMYAQQQHLPQIHASEAWDVQKGDSTVIIGIVDTGVDYDHEDLAANVWTNELEANGVAGVDDDDNGFVDDIHGWDFGNNDNDPKNPPPSRNQYDHGTHCAGIACAITNNDIGVAGVSWNCEYMPVKVTGDDTASILVHGFEGIIYAADNAADVISNSWGGFTFLQWEQDVINYAYAKGAVIVCSAGNYNSEIFHYPAFYQHTICVAAVRVNDIKTGYSNFGPWIDICAPGGSADALILSTIPDNKYEGMGGTSMAAPIVAGVCGLVKSLHPDWTNNQIVKQVLLSADNIDALNPQYLNWLGHGRVNALRALIDNILPEPDSRLALFSASLSDSLYGNDNGVFDRGETIQLHCNIQNCSIGGTNAATLRLSCTSADVEIVNGTGGPASFPADTTLPFDFTIRIGNSAPAAFELVLVMETSRGYSREETFEITVGNRALLLIDNDFGYPNARLPDVELFFRDILEKHNVQYGYWNMQRTEFPDAQTLEQFPIVVLSCSGPGGRFNEQERNVLRAYLNDGGNLFICGQDVGYELDKLEKTFLNDYLHAEYLADDSEDQEVKGVAGDPISQGLSFHIWQPLLYEGWQRPEVIAPTAGASTIFTYSGDRAAAVKYAGDHKVVYFAFGGLEAVDSDEYTQIGDSSPIRTELFMRILNWLNFIEHEPLKFTNENVDSSRTVAARITGNVSDLQAVTLFWRLRGQTNFMPVLMVETTARQYAAQIPGPGAPATIEYFFQTTHPYYNWQSPVDAPNNVYSCYVGPDTVSPEITQVSPIRNRLSDRESYPIQTIITDNLGIDSSAVYVHYEVKNRAIADSVLLISSGEVGHFVGELPLKFSVGDTVVYRVSARDISVAGNIGSSEWQSFMVGYEDFETGLQSWQVEPNGWNVYRWGHNGKYSVSNSPGGSYPLNQDVSLTSKYGVDLSQTDKAVLTFWTAYNIKENKDFGCIEISNDSAKTWQRLGTVITGTSINWKAVSVSLSAFTGHGFDDVRIRFRFISDSTQSQGMAGCFIDDVKIIPGIEVGITDPLNKIATPQSFTLYQNYPNPFNPSTTIEFALPKSAFVTLKVYNLLGEEVATLVAEKQEAGIHKLNWDARGLASGVYLYRLEVGEFMQTKKFILMR